MQFKFNKEIYPAAVLLKSAYSFTDKAYVHLDEKEGYYIVDIEAKTGCKDIEEKDFINEMLFPSGLYVEFSSAEVIIVLFVLINSTQLAVSPCAII